VGRAFSIESSYPGSISKFVRHLMAFPPLDLDGDA